MSVLPKPLRDHLKNNEWNTQLLQSYGMVLSKLEVSKVSGLRVGQVDEIKQDLLPRIKFKGGSSPCLILRADLDCFLESDFGSLVLSNRDAHGILTKGLQRSFGETMSREDVAIVLHVSPVTISRNASSLLSPCVEARGRKGGRYLTENISEYLISGRSRDLLCDQQ
jgi:hypothetical protein